MVALDLHRHPLTGFRVNVGAGALDHIGVKGALGQVIEGTQAAALLFKHADEFRSNDFALLFRIGDVFEFFDETLASIDVFNVNVEFAIEEIHEEFRLPFPHESLVDEHAGELITDGFLQQKSEGGGIDPPDRASRTRLSPTWDRTCFTASSMNAAVVQSGSQPQMW